MRTGSIPVFLRTHGAEEEQEPTEDRAPASTAREVTPGAHPRASTPPAHQFDDIVFPAGRSWRIFRPSVRPKKTSSKSAPGLCSMRNTADSVVIRQALIGSPSFLE